MVFVLFITIAFFSKLLDEIFEGFDEDFFIIVIGLVVITDLSTASLI